MMHLLVFLLLAPGGGSIGDNRIDLRDRLQGPTPVTDKDLRPAKAPDCRDEAEVQRTLDQLSRGELGDCFIRDRRAFIRR